VYRDSLDRSIKVRRVSDSDGGMAPDLTMTPTRYWKRSSPPRSALVGALHGDAEAESHGRGTSEWAQWVLASCDLTVASRARIIAMTASSAAAA
jgi:hypothetical protein